MDIGKPRRIFTVEPVETPVPEREPRSEPKPTPEPQQEPAPTSG